jgi:hypothetical protein
VEDHESPTISEREKWESERSLRERELAIREGELAIKRQDQAGSGWRNPLVVAILAATAAAGGNAIVAVVNGHLQRDLESQKSEQTRILEMIKTGDEEKAADNLEFLLKTGLIDDPVRAAKIQKYLAERIPGKGPSLPAASGASPPSDTERFTGVERKTAKLTPATGKPDIFADLSTLLDSLPPDAEMQAAKIAKGPDSGRVAQENKVVTVRAFIYAAKLEMSNDYACILGVDPKQPARFMMVRVSGLPAADSSSFAELEKARNQFKAFLGSRGLKFPGLGYTKYDPPVPVQVTGSLFFNTAHRPGVVGPTGMQPQTTWEIHPVADLEYKPQDPR